MIGTGYIETIGCILRYWHSYKTGKINSLFER